MMMVSVHNIVAGVEGVGGRECWLLHRYNSSWPLSIMCPVDQVTLTLEKDEVRVSEDSGNVTVEIRKIGASERPVSVRVFTESGSAEGIYR